MEQLRHIFWRQSSTRVLYCDGDPDRTRNQRQSLARRFERFRYSNGGLRSRRRNGSVDVQMHFELAYRSVGSAFDAVAEEVDENLGESIFVGEDVFDA